MILDNEVREDKRRTQDLLAELDGGQQELDRKKRAIQTACAIIHDFIRQTEPLPWDSAVYVAIPFNYFRSLVLLTSGDVKVVRTSVVDCMRNGTVEVSSLPWAEGFWNIPAIYAAMNEIVCWLLDPPKRISKDKTFDEYSAIYFAQAKEAR